MHIQTVAVVGAGNMGGGMAQALAAAGCRVRLHDVNPEALEGAVAGIRGHLRRRVESGKMSPAAAERLLERLSTHEELAAAVDGADLVVEAIFEDLDAKRDLFGRLSELCPAKTILATNTSSFYVSQLAEAVSHPERVVGLHFFFPAAVNRLVEVIRGPTTLDGVFDAAWALVESAGKIAVETADSPGFCVNRFFVPWLNEACRLLEEGVADGATIDAVARDAFGVAMGPFALMDVTGPVIALHAQRTLHRELGAFYEPSAALAAQVESGESWSVEGKPDPGRADAVRDRLLGVVFAVACQLQAEEVVGPRDADLAAVTGLRWRAGPFALMNEVGTPEALRLVETLRERWGEALPPPGRLHELAEAGRPWELPAVSVEFPEEDGGRVARVVLDRPERRNSLSRELLEDLDRALDEIEARGSVRAVVVTGRAGSFAAGADIPSMVELDSTSALAYTEAGARVLDRLADLPAAVIMAINGPALGGGLELALTGDLLLAADGVKLGLPEVGLGLHPGWGGTQRLPRRVGLGAAKDMVLTGRAIRAAEAQRIALVNEVVPAAQLGARALELARTIAQKAPLAVAGAKRAMDRGLATDLRHGLELERESIVLLFDTRDKREGLTAFLERRQPRFEGA